MPLLFATGHRQGISDSSGRPGYGLEILEINRTGVSMVLQLDGVHKYVAGRFDGGLFLIRIPFDRRRRG